MIQNTSEEDIYYFAYASNIDENIMQSRCKNSILISTNAVLEGYNIANDSFLSIKKSENRNIEGCIYKLNKEDLKKLDVYEGYPFVYNRIKKKIINKTDNTILNCYVYINNEYLLNQ